MTIPNGYSPSTIRPKCGKWSTDAASTDGDGYVQFTTESGDTVTILPHSQTVNVSLFLDNDSGSDAAWSVHPVTSGGTIGAAVSSGTLATGNAEQVHDDVIGSHSIAVKCDQAILVEVILK